MITKIDTNTLKSTNKRITDILFIVEGWGFGSDLYKNKNINKKDAGFLLDSFNNDSNYFNNDILNTYAQLVFDTVEKNTCMKFKKLNRVFWNWYHSGSLMEFHQDDRLEDNKFSIIYNLHDNDGGTEFKIDDKITFYKSIESQALLFPSKLYHRGIAPKTNVNRFALNIMVEI